MPRTVLVVAGGARPDPDVVRWLPPVDLTVAADSGADHARRLGLAVDVLVGDLDSVSADTLAALRAGGVELREHPARKDQTDFELAMARAAEARATRIVVIGIGGDRLDHELANIAVLAADRYGGAEVEGLVGPARVTVIRGARSLAGVPGETVSLLPVLGPVEGVTTVGLEFELAGEPLHPGTARGVSNRFVAAEATVRVERGTLLAVQPHGLAGTGER